MEAIKDKFHSLSTYQKNFHNEEDIRKMVYRPFGKTGLYTSLLGYGASGLAWVYGTDKEQEGIDTVIAAVKSGINYIDTAPFYGQGKSEIVLGKALKLIPRSAYYLATKIGRYGPDVSDLFDFSAARTEKSVEESLSRLGVDYFDLLQVHDLEFAPSIDIIVNETLPTLQKMKDLGKTKFIGITGYPLSKLKEVLEKSPVQIDAVLSYCRCTLFDDTLNSYISYFKENNLAVISAAAIGMSLLSNKGPPDWHPATSEIRNVCQQAAKNCRAKNVDISRLAVCHTLSQPGIDVHLVGMENMRVLKENLQTLWYGLTNEEKVVKQDVIGYFNCLKQTHWENIEVNHYWHQMKNMS